MNKKDRIKNNRKFQKEIDDIEFVTPTVRPFFEPLDNIVKDTLAVLDSRGLKYNRNHITPELYLLASPAIDQIAVIFLRLKACKDDPPEVLLDLYADLINYALMEMCRITNERSRDAEKENQ
jgi:hypothetical protein